MSPETARVALVTGASQGIGAACAAALSAAGYQVALVARNAQALEDVAANLPGDSLVLPTDVTDPAALEAAFSTVESEWGPVEVLVVNAGAAMSAPVVKTSDEDWQRMLDLNLTAPFRCLRRALPAMTQAGWGRVVVVASIAGKTGGARI
ncbi:MAG TPA: SDR family NAD(P)-dependent oxidoreductase, partial [Actinomycetes bacterium]